ncbi:MAG: hypothetical protein ACK56I_13320 [bacterium]
MPACDRDSGNDLCAKLVGQLRERGIGEAPQIGRFGDGVENGCQRAFGHASLLSVKKASRGW